MSTPAPLPSMVVMSECAVTDTSTFVTNCSAGVNTTATQHPIMSGHCDRCRLLKYVQITPTCWLWTGTFYTQFGRPTYGQFYLAGKRTGAHRASFIIHKGPVPDGLDILHSCDVKACVNPEHLRAGTHQENIAEAYAKKPAGKYGGENHPRARLDWPSVRAIRAASAEGVSHADLGSRYGVTPTHINHIVKGLRWVEPRAAEVAA